MSTKKSKLAGALAIVLTLGVLCAGTGLLASENAKADDGHLNQKTENHKSIDHKNKQHKEANCKDNHNEKKDCSQDQCD